MSDSFRLQLLFAKYLQRACTSQEIDELVQLLHRAEAEDDLTEPMRKVWEEIKNDPAADNVDWDKMYAHITDDNNYPGSHFTKSSRVKFLSRNFAIAASVLFAIILATYFLVPRNSSRHDIMPGVSQTEKAADVPANRQTIHLPDGSTVILNKGSKLNYPSSFANNRRDVYLYGEAFFDIQHDASRPFVVHSGKIAVKVLGTAFNIKIDPARSKIAVTVTRGKVQVLNNNKNLGVLTATQQLVFDDQSETATTQSVDTTAVIAWKPAEIFFNDITMDEAARQIDQRFGHVVTFEEANAKNCRVTAKFSEDDSLEEVLTVICAVTGTDYTINNQKIMIHGKGCHE